MTNLRSKAQRAKDWQAFLREMRTQIKFEQRMARRMRQLGFGEVVVRRR